MPKLYRHDTTLRISFRILRNTSLRVELDLHAFSLYGDLSAFHQLSFNTETLQSGVSSCSTRAGCRRTACEKILSRSLSCLESSTV